ncbi:MAG: bacillithiol system redox-active protein YtxJ [Chitinophagales bacterium]|nr:bacillithiol system redox-active protein YtxJ [Chitinophagales bacterium]
MSKVNWFPLTSISQLSSINESSHEVPCLIFKHSTRCSISSVALNRLEKTWNISENKVVPYFLDLIAYRDVSNAVAEEYGIRHESPQMLIIKEGRAVYDASHFEISINTLSEQLT